MSYDLYLHAAPGSQATWSDVCQWVETRPEFSVGENQIGYQHPQTGVYFTLDRSSDTAIAALNINYNRPSFFAHEAMPLVAELAGSLNLHVIDPQGPGTLEVAAPDALIERWSAGNRSAVGALSSLGAAAPMYMPPENSIAWWRYVRLHDAIKEELDDYFVPQLMLVASEGHALRVAVLTEPCMYVVPPADFLILNRGGAGGFLVRATRFTEAVGSFLTDSQEFPVRIVSEMTVFDGDVVDVWQRFYDGAAADLELSSLSRLAPDGFVDVKV